MTQEIKIPITPTLQGIAREAEFTGFSFWYHDRQEAEMLCRVWLINSEGNRIENADIQQGRVVRIEISNRNRVNEQGIVLDPNSEEWQLGIPEYDFYFSAFMLNTESTPLQVIIQAMQILAQFNRFDRP
jgi:hypothetical protein